MNKWVKNNKGKNDLRIENAKYELVSVDFIRNSFKSLNI
jgi:hypothetical protein